MGTMEKNHKKGEKSQWKKKTEKKYKQDEKVGKMDNNEQLKKQNGKISKTEKPGQNWKKKLKNGQGGLNKKKYIKIEEK